jgi:hypothetical protein
MAEGARYTILETTAAHDYVSSQQLHFQVKTKMSAPGPQNISPVRVK